MDAFVAPAVVLEAVDEQLQRLARVSDPVQRALSAQQMLAGEELSEQQRALVCLLGAQAVRQVELNAAAVSRWEHGGEQAAGRVWEGS